MGVKSAEDWADHVPPSRQWLEESRLERRERTGAENTVEMTVKVLCSARIS